MAFTGSITRKEMVGGKLRIHYQLNDGAGIIIDEFVETSTARNLTWLANYILARCSEVDSLAAFSAEIPEGQVTKPADPPAPPAPDPIIVGFLSAFGEALAMKAAVENGILAANNAQVVAARDELRRQFQENPSYLDRFKLILRR